MSNLFALIVEDDNDLAIIFAMALQEAGFETQIVRAGDTALMWLSSSTPDIVVLDLHLPRVSGDTILKEIRADARLAKTKVIITTADPRMAEMLDDKADLVLLKPVGFSQLRDLAARLGMTRLAVHLCRGFVAHWPRSGQAPHYAVLGARLLAGQDRPGEALVMLGRLGAHWPDHPEAVALTRQLQPPTNTA